LPSADRLSFVSSGTPEAEAALARLRQRYGDAGLDGADVVVALGGDGLMLATLHDVMDRGVPVYGMNLGTVGFLMNEFGADDLPARVGASKPTQIFPLSMQVTDANGVRHAALALNDVAVSPLTVGVQRDHTGGDGTPRPGQLRGGGVPRAPRPGSPPYHFAAPAPIPPPGAPVLAAPPSPPPRPRRWRGAILNNHAAVTFRMRESAKRPTNAVADNVEFRNVVEVTVREDREHRVTLLFDPGTGLEERVLAEQFRY